MFRLLPLLFLLLASPASAQDCPPELYQQVSDLTVAARAGEVAAESLGGQANALSQLCGDDRVLLGQFMALFTTAGLAIEPPSDSRFQAHLIAFRTANRIARREERDFAPVPLEAGNWTQADERDAYWDLSFAMSSDFLVFGVHQDLYTAGITERIGCQLYPAEEASALATQARDGADSGELVVRMSYLGTNCDDPERFTSGQVARYFANHAQARQADPDGYLGLTGGDLRAGLAAFLTKHLDGRESSALFSAEEVKDLMEF